MSWYPSLSQVYSHLSKWLENPLTKEWGYNHGHKDLSVGHQYNLVITDQLQSFCTQCFHYSLQVPESTTGFTSLACNLVTTSELRLGCHIVPDAICASGWVAPCQLDGEWSLLKTPFYCGFNYVSLGLLGNRCQGRIRRDWFWEMFVKGKKRRIRNRLEKPLDGNEVWHLKGEGETRRNRKKTLKLQSRLDEVSVRLMGSSSAKIVCWKRLSALFGRSVHTLVPLCAQS